MTRLYIVRHGNTFDEGDIARRIGRRTDLPLSNSGRQQARALGSFFAGQNIALDHIASSPLKRAVETAEEIRSKCLDTRPIQRNAALLEIDYGPDENQPEPAVIERLGKQALLDWDERAIVPPGWRADPSALIGNWKNIFASAHSDFPNGNILAVTSNGIARFALAAAQTESTNQKLRTGAIGCFEISDEKVSLLFWDRRP